MYKDTCKVNLDMTKEENIDFVIYSTILSLKTEFTIEDLIKEIQKRNSFLLSKDLIDTRIHFVLDKLIDESIIHDNYFNYVKVL